jgi:hypothetical protein
MTCTAVGKWGQPKEGVMRQLSSSTVMFQTSHWLAVDVAVCATGANPGAQSSKRTRIWAGGLSTAGGNLPR